MQFEITSGKVTGKGMKVVAYGPEGIGKSTFAACFPMPVFIDTEGSTDSMEVMRLPKPTSWYMLRDEAAFIGSGGTNCKTLVIDTFDWAEQLCINMLCEKHKKNGIEDFGYGNGYVYEREEIGRFLTQLEDLTQKGINVVILCHAQTRKYELPEELGQYDRWELKLGKKTGSQISPLVKEWADLVLFMNYKTHVYATDKDGKKHKAAGRDRVMYTSHHPCWDAKNRCGLDDELPLSYGSIAHVIPGNAPNVSPVQQMLEKTKQHGIPVQEQLGSLDDFEEIDSGMELPFDDKPSENSGYQRVQGIPDELADLMEAHNVTAANVQYVCSQVRNYFLPDMPLQNYPPDFVQGVLIAAWPQVLDMIQTNCPDYIPFT